MQKKMKISASIIFCLFFCSCSTMKPYEFKVRESLSPNSSYKRFEIELR